MGNCMSASSGEYENRNNNTISLRGFNNFNSNQRGPSSQTTRTTLEIEYNPVHDYFQKKEDEKSIIWMEMPRVDNCAKGLEYLTELAELKIDKIVHYSTTDSIEFFYLVKNSSDELIYRGIGNEFRHAYYWQLMLFDRNNQKVLELKVKFNIKNLMLLCADCTHDYWFDFEIKGHHDESLIGFFRTNPNGIKNGVPRALLDERAQEKARILDYFNESTAGVAYEIRDSKCINTLGRFKRLSKISSMLTMRRDLCVKMKASILASIILLENRKQ